MNYTVGSRIIDVHDSHHDITFKSWMLYPCVGTPEPIKAGPFDFEGCEAGDYAVGRFPLVVISHGGGGSHLLYRSVALHLAANGYWVVMPEHYGNNRRDNSLGKSDANLTFRTRHIRLLIDTLAEDSEISHYMDMARVLMIGHSMGGTTALSLVGAVPWSAARAQVAVTRDNRIKAIVLFAPATQWFQHPNSFKEVNLPIYVFAAEHDRITPPWQAEMILERAPNPALVKFEMVQNAGHMSFLTPYPNHMKTEKFPPAQDPNGFNREAFHDGLKRKVLAFLDGVQVAHTG